MNKFYIVAILMLFVGCAVDRETTQTEQNKQEPIKIGEADGVTVWKIKDTTYGGQYYIYFTSTGQILKQ